MWVSVKYKQNTVQEKLGAAIAVYEHQTLGVFTYTEDRIDVNSKSAEFVVRAKAALIDWVALQIKYETNETSMLAALNA